MTLAALSNADAEEGPCPVCADRYVVRAVTFPGGEPALDPRYVPCPHCTDGRWLAEFTDPEGAHDDDD